MARMTAATTATTATEDERRPAHRGARRRVALFAVAALALASSCTKTDEVSTSTTVGPAATSAPGTTEPATEEPGTTVKKSGTTSTTKKGGGTSSTTDKRPGTTKKPSSTSTTLDVDTPPDAVEFCAKTNEVKEIFEDDPGPDADKDAYVKVIAVQFDALTAVAPDAIVADMETINEIFQSASTYAEMTEAFADAALKEVTDRIDEYMLATCGFKL